MMALQKERGVNPLAGCLPILPQIPVFLVALPRAAPAGARAPRASTAGRDELTDEAARAKLFGAPISASFNMTGAKEAAILEIPAALHRHPHRRVRADRDHVLHDLLHAEADHEALRPGRGPGRHGAEAAALRHAAEPLRLRLLLPDRRPALLVHQQPVDPGPAVLHPAQAAAARVGRRTRPRPPPTSRPSTRRRWRPSPAPSRSAPSRGRPATATPPAGTDADAPTPPRGRTARPADRPATAAAADAPPAPGKRRRRPGPGRPGARRTGASASAADRRTGVPPARRPTTTGSARPPAPTWEEPP